MPSSILPCQLEAQVSPSSILPRRYQLPRHQQFSPLRLSRCLLLNHLWPLSGHLVPPRLVLVRLSQRSLCCLDLPQPLPAKLRPGCKASSAACQASPFTEIHQATRGSLFKSTPPLAARHAIRGSAPTPAQLSPPSTWLTSGTSLSQPSLLSTGSASGSVSPQLPPLAPQSAS